MQTVYTRPGVHGYNWWARKSSELLKLCEIGEFSEDVSTFSRVILHPPQSQGHTVTATTQRLILPVTPKRQAHGVSSSLLSWQWTRWYMHTGYNLCSTISRVVHRNSVGKSPWGYHARSIRTLQSWPQQDRGLQCYHWSRMFLKPTGHAYPLSGLIIGQSQWVWRSWVNIISS